MITITIILKKCFKNAFQYYGMDIFLSVANANIIKNIPNIKKNIKQNGQEKQRNVITTIWQEKINAEYWWLH